MLRTPDGQGPAELVLDLIRGSGLVADPDQRVGRVSPLGLLGVDEVRLMRTPRVR
ncbi:hypothetical protein [Streptomyces jumonjinensis]|uniref:hypothetical protein n=1 Tax=Streptomyces jumonjinensis TaxID=1945 RepID=UPI001297AD4A|nr:hypothetical protein [Streptomyces jumonjinensis]